MKYVLEKTINYILSKVVFILILGFSLYVNIIPQDLLGMVITLIISILLTLIILINRKQKIIVSNKTIILSIVACIVLFVAFINRWTNSERIISLANILHINTNIFVVFVAIIIQLFTFFFLLSFLSIFESKVINDDTEEREQINTSLNIKTVIYCFVISVIVVTICSKSSFLYPLNDWVDANCYFTVGKSVLSGKVIYRDLFEQKGPFLYFLHTIASLISYNSFFGVYLIEIVSCTFYLYYAYKIITLYDAKAAIIMTPVLAMLTYTSKAFCHGDSAEELCLPFITYAIYISLLSVKNNVLFTKKESIIIGITSGCVLWTKYTLLGCYVGLVIIPLSIWIRNKIKAVEILKVFVYILLGVFISSIPYIIYFGVNGAIKDLLYVYFYENIFGYTSYVSDTIMGKIIYGVYKGYRRIKTFNDINAVICVLGLVWLLFVSNSKEILHVLFMLAFSYLFIFAGGKALAYYSLILSPFVIWGLVFLYRTLKLSKVYDSKFILVASYLALLIYTINFNENKYLMFENKGNMPQYKFAEIVRKKENATLLNYGFLDGGFYTTTGIVPNCRSFCLTNFPSHELFDLQGQFCEEGLIDYIVSRDNEVYFDKYELISKCDYYYEREIHEYYLYGLK